MSSPIELKHKYIFGAKPDSGSKTFENRRETINGSEEKRKNPRFPRPIPIQAE